MTLTDHVARHFREHEGEWISMQTLAAIGGTGGWRTRVSNCRVELGMTIENKWRDKKLEDGRVIRESFYRYVPADDFHLRSATVADESQRTDLPTAEKDRAARTRGDSGRFSLRPLFDLTA